jgi:antirestriction protein
MTTTTLTKPMGEWFTQLDAETQADITEMVNENGYPLSDIQDFIETHGAKAYIAGHYATWCQITEELGISNEVVEAFVEEFGIDSISGFEDSYCGTYSSGAEYAQELVEGAWDLDRIPSFVEINWEATWDNLSGYYTEVDGHIFNNRF